MDKYSRNKFNKKIPLLFLTTMIVPFLCSCGGSKSVVKAVLDEDYPDVLHVGEVDFSKMKFDLTYSNGTTEQIPVTREMVQEDDLYKFYQVGEWKVRFNYQNFYSIADFTIIENTFSDDIKLENATVAYDGAAHSLLVTGPVPEGTFIYYPEGNSFTEASPIPYHISAVLVKEGYVSKSLSGELTIIKSEYSQQKLNQIEFKDATFVYDGTAKSIEAKNVPIDIKVEYFVTDEKGIVTEGNKKTEAGVYTVTAKLTCLNLNYLPINNISATLTIQKAKYDSSKLIFESQTFGYDGKHHSLEVEGLKSLPGDVKVEYTNNDQINAGEYNVVATFVGNPNFEQIPSMTAKLNIVKQDIDLGVVKYNIQEVTYDGNAHEYTNIEGNYPKDLLNLVKKYFIEDDSETGLTEVDEAIDAGIYRVVISYEFKDSINPNNYNLININPKNGILVINKKNLDFSTVQYNTQTVTFDGNPHEYTDIEGTIPQEVNVVKKYYAIDVSGGKIEVETPIDAGTYEVVISYEFKDGCKSANYNLVNIPKETGTLIIEKKTLDLSSMQYSPQTVEFDGNPHEFTNIEGTLPEELNLVKKYYINDQSGRRVEVEKPTDAGTYTVEISYEFKEGLNPNNYNVVNIYSQISSLIITKQEIDLGSLIYHEQIDKYDGEPHNYWFIEGYVPLDVLTMNKKYFIKDDSQYGKTEVDQAIEVGTYFVEISYSFKDSVNPDNYDIKNIPLDYGILIIEAAE